MVPFSISPLSETETPSPVWTPPSSFLEPSPPIERVSIRWHGASYQRRKGNTAAREAGLRFEKKVQLWLLDHLPLYEAEPHIRYWTAKGPRNAFPDGLLLLPERTVIFEVKRQHMPEAWWQLRKHYQPVMERYRCQPVQVCEIVGDFDLQMPFPEQGFHFFERSGLPEFLEMPPAQFGVMWWKP